jgi:precorrin-6A/cobalt-precorrin-6A reductase
MHSRREDGYIKRICDMIWLVGGTSDAMSVAIRLSSEGYDVMMTVATAYGEKLYGKDKKVSVLRKKMTKDEMMDFIRTYYIEAVVDASHPYAAMVSANAMNASFAASIPYFRYERRNAEPEPVIEQAKNVCRQIKRFASYDEAVRYLNGTVGNILVTTGTKDIGCYKVLDPRRIFLRVLSSSESVKKCEDAGYLPDNIIAMKGSFSCEMNRAMIEEFGIKFLVTKESGAEGGFYGKINAAFETGAEVIIIDRPACGKLESYSDIGELMQKLGKAVKGC